MKYGLRAVLEKIFLAESPIAPASREPYPTTAKLPGEKFSLDHKSFERNYAVPVMTYC